MNMAAGKRTADDVAGKAAEMAEAGRETKNRIAREASEKADEFNRAAYRELADLAETIQAKLKDIGFDAGEMANQAKTRVAQAEKTVAAEVAEHPLRSLAIAAAAGVVIGLVARR